ncbi:unnamed protein product [Coffea canephora]|uniref:LOB domain-containing protein n=2 Tax=Coffea TaxID=13442 RepID=A0A068TWE6_COFCA|nr:LOB domain-containing protein 40-like [Coffea arabica]CDP00620.1 unnamed protein product [Coffea canephora]
MRMSCNGCRVLRKGCGEDCTLRPCLQWIKTPESQANATVFLAKFYGRAGLVNLINAGPDHLRPEIFRSLLYEACGRIINPIYGSVGLLWSGNWQRCQAAVEAVLEGSPIMQVSTDDAAAGGHPITPLKDCDIRHLSKKSNGIHRVRTRNRFKRSGFKSQVDSVPEFMNETTKFSITGWNDDEENDGSEEELMKRAPSHDSFSVETVEPTLVSRAEQGRVVKSETILVGEDDDLVLDLTLGVNPVVRTHLSAGGRRL